MNAFNHAATHLVSAAVLAATVSLYSTATLAGPDRFFLERSDELINLHIAYNAHRWPVYGKIHRQDAPVKTDIASLEEKSAAVGDRPTVKPETRSDRLRAPYSRKRR